MFSEPGGEWQGQGQRPPRAGGKPLGGRQGVYQEDGQEEEEGREGQGGGGGDRWDGEGSYG